MILLSLKIRLLFTSIFKKVYKQIITIFSQINKQKRLLKDLKRQHHWTLTS